MVTWEFDTQPDLAYPLYCRGWAEEFLPDVVSPLTSTLFLPAYERAWREYFVHTLPVLPEPESDRTMAHVFGGHFYINLSVLRRSGDLSTVLEREDVEAFFAPKMTLPPYVRPDEPDYDERPERISEEGITYLFWQPEAEVADDFEGALALRQHGRTEREAMADADLLDRMHEIVLPALELRCHRHLIVSGFARIAYGALRKGLRDLSADADALLRKALASTAVESARPAHAIAELARSGPALDEGIARLLDEFGYRGPNEWELASPSWEMTPERLRSAIESAPPAERHGELTERREAGAAARQDILDMALDSWEDGTLWLQSAEFYMPNRERTKASCIMLVNELRRDAFELGTRLAAVGRLRQPSDVYLLSIEELRETIEAPASRAARIEDRRRAMDELRALSAPVLIDASESTPSSWPASAPAPSEPVAVIHGVGASPGTVSGRALVAASPYDDIEIAEDTILVLRHADPGWSHLFVSVAGIVLEQGHEVSHVGVIARELGLPAVVGATGCTRAITTGDAVFIDGDTGEISVTATAALVS